MSSPTDGIAKRDPHQQSLSQRNEPRREESASSRGRVWVGLTLGLILDAGLPFVAFEVLQAHRVAVVDSLAIGAVFPLIGLLAGWVRTRHLDGIAMFVLAGLLAGVASSLVSGNATFAVLKDSTFTGVFGVICLISLLFSRPLMFYFGRQFATGGVPEREAYWDGLWQYASFRRPIRITTVVWGLVLLAEATLRILLTFLLPTATVVTVSSPMAVAVIALLILWTNIYGARTRRQAREAEAARHANFADQD